jgi:hypothetical protein
MDRLPVLIGFCGLKFYSSKNPTSQAAGNGANGHASKSVHAAASRANGHASKSGKNGKTDSGPVPQKIDRDELIEERITAVILAWPAAEKMRVVRAWLAGAI